MTDNEIIKALECCLTNHINNCANCPNGSYPSSYLQCRYKLNNDVLDLINRQKAEIENLNKDLSDTIALNYKERQELKTKIEEQRFVISCMETGRVILERQRKNVWDTAIRKFAERLHKYGAYVTTYEIDETKEEMVGDV